MKPALLVMPAIFDVVYVYLNLSFCRFFQCELSAFSLKWKGVGWAANLVVHRMKDDGARFATVSRGGLNMLCRRVYCICGSCLQRLGWIDVDYCRQQCKQQMQRRSPTTEESSQKCRPLNLV